MYGGLITIAIYATFEEADIADQAILTEDNFDLLTESSDVLQTET